MKGKPITLTIFCDNISTRIVTKIVIIPFPIAVETEFPNSSCRKSDDVVILCLMQEVSNDHNIIR